MLKKTIIHGCEARGDGDKPYLIRYTLFECKKFQVLLHIFVRSDADELHDHPWDFVSIPLWRGYWEEALITNDGITMTNRIKPFSINYRPATYAHRVVLIPDRHGKELKAITLVVTGKRVRLWGFYTKQGWMNFIKYFKLNRC